MILSPLIRQRFFSANGAPLAGGKLQSYIAGTTTPQATYTDQGGGSPNTNPVILDANGEANVWVDPSLAYKFILKDSSDVVQWTVDQVSGAGLTGAPQWSITSNYQQGNIVADASGSGLLYVSLTNNNLGNALTSVANWRAFGGGTRTLTSNTSLAVTDEVVRSNSTSGSLTHTLPACSSTPIGKRITVKDVGTGGFTTSVKGAGTDQVDGAVTYATALKQYDAITVSNTGTTWDVIPLIIPDGSVAAAKIADSAVATAKLADGAVTQVKRAALGQQVSSSCGVFSTTSGTFVDVTNLSVTITTTGRPVYVGLQSDGTAGGSLNGGHNAGASGIAGFEILRGATIITGVAVGIVAAGDASVYLSVPHSTLHVIDVPVAGTYTYKVQAKTITAGGFAGVENGKLVAYEL